MNLYFFKLEPMYSDEDAMKKYSDADFADVIFLQFRIL